MAMTIKMEVYKLYQASQEAIGFDKQIVVEPILKVQM